METIRETPSTLISLMVSHPSFYELRRSPSYRGLLCPSSTCPVFLNFKTDSLYQFPLIDAQSTENEIHALISSSLFTYTKKSDINPYLEDLHKNSPFKSSKQYPRIKINEFSNLNLNSNSNSNLDLLSNSFILEDSDFQDSSSVISYIFNQDGQIIDDKDRETICNLLTDFHRKPGNINNLNSLTPASSYQESSFSGSFDSRLSPAKNGSQGTDDLCMSLAEEGTIQSVKCTCEVEVQASKNLWSAVHPKPDLVRVAQKDLTSLNSPFTSLVQEATHYHPTSPILRKLVFCNHVSDSSDTLEIVAAVSTTGFVAALNLEYSNIDIQNKAYADHSKAEKFLLTSQISRAIAHNSAIWLSCGFEHCALINSAGKVMTWGYGTSGCLGHGDKASVGFPKLVHSLKDVACRYIECGGYHTLAITEGSDGFVWGRGDVNQLGLSHKDLTRDDYGLVALRPKKLEWLSHKIKGAACGEAHTLVLDDKGSIISFGWGDDGQLGTMNNEESGLDEYRICYLDFDFGTSVVKVVAGSIFSACLNECGEVFVWGSADKGQFGREVDAEFICGPVKIEVCGIVDLVCGESRVLCLAENGDVFGWGLGKAGHFSHDFSLFTPGSELVCNSVKLLGEADVVHHVII